MKPSSLEGLKTNLKYRRKMPEHFIKILIGIIMSMLDFFPAKEILFYFKPRDK